MLWLTHSKSASCASRSEHGHLLLREYKEPGEDIEAVRKQEDDGDVNGTRSRQGIWDRILLL